ncbi:hypothetical protein BDW02DRAFT_507917, partial [Decorospora gaudefroyi]
MENSQELCTTNGFQHQPLDRTQPSIRLLEIKPRLDPNTSKTVLLNGKPFVVWRNLFNFLDLASTHHWSGLSTPCRYWVDALCIDQSSILERNHQVAQMGKIFAGAQRVHVWLGQVPSADTECVRSFFEDPVDKISFSDWSFTIRRNMHVIECNIFHNEYWSRAWVTQEILLARDVVIVCGTHHIKMLRLVERARYFVLNWFDTAFQLLAIPENDHSQTAGLPLITLLSYFRLKKCKIAHDRVYSLLSLCNGPDVVSVDYNVRCCDLAYQIL